MLNKQLKKKNGREVRGIEWTDYTINPIGGCLHACKWTMPDGGEAECYAKTVAEGVASRVYTQGFEYHYWRGSALQAPKTVKVPSKFFIDSMSDLFGHWVPENHLMDVLAMCDDTPWHVYQSLTKNPKRILKVAEQRNYPRNLWIGVSTPPDQMWGHTLTRAQQEKMLHITLQVLTALRELYDHPVRWISAEPLSWDIAPIVARYPKALSWCVIGAASRGNVYYQPNRDHLMSLLDVLDDQGVPVFFKGNLAPSFRGEMFQWRELFPGFEETRWNQWGIRMIRQQERA